MTDRHKFQFKEDAIKNAEERTGDKFDLSSCPHCGHSANLTDPAKDPNTWGGYQWSIVCSSSHCRARVCIVADGWFEQVNMDGNTEILLTGIKELRSLLSPSNAVAAEPRLALASMIESRPDLPLTPSDWRMIVVALRAAPPVRDREAIIQKALVPFAELFDTFEGFRAARGDNWPSESVEFIAISRSDKDRVDFTFGDLKFAKDAILSLPSAPRKELSDTREEIIQLAASRFFDSKLENLPGALADKVRDFADDILQSYECIYDSYTLVTRRKEDIDQALADGAAVRPVR